jgi:2-polyprenyl-6-methoxyphenol hydroxylase-like FAD-dependent oxidoreductase
MASVLPLARHYDAVVVGALCAGAATGMLLARAGTKVLIVDRDAPGTDTLSTHALMRGAVSQLSRWGLLPRIVAAGTPAIRTTRFAYGTEGVEVEIKPSQGVDALFAPRRMVLDPVLAAGAAETGAGLVGPDRQVVEVAAGLVIGADGRRSTVARQVGAPVIDAGTRAAAVVFAYVEGLEDRGYRWHYGLGASAGAIPTNFGQHCVFVSVPPERFRAEMRGDFHGGLMRGLAEVDPALAAEVAAGRIVSRPLGFAGEPGFLKRSHGPGWALVGDAGYFKDPITSHGITDALRDAEILARPVIEEGERGLARYQAARDALSLELFRLTDRIAGLDWDFETVEGLHRDLSRAMKAEQDWMAEAWAGSARAA